MILYFGGLKSPVPTSICDFSVGGRLDKCSNFYQKNNSLFGLVNFFLPMRGENLVTDTDIVA